MTLAKRVSTAARWPVGIALTGWRYMWRTTPVHRWELSGSASVDAAPELPEGVDLSELQRTSDGAGPLVHRLYRARIVGSSLTPERLLRRMTDDLDAVAPSEFASFQKVQGGRRLEVGDEYTVRMPGPYDGPVRVIAAAPTSFRLATLEGHLEAGQIEFRIGSDHRSLEFTIESWARSGDRFSDLLFTRLRLAKEVQLHMWTSVLARVVELSGGRIEGGMVITTRRVDPAELSGDTRESEDRKTDRKLAALSALEVNFDMSRIDEYTPESGWHVDDMVEALPHEPSGPPVDGGSWSVCRGLMVEYQLADPTVVRAFYRRDAPLAGRDMLLRIRFLGLPIGVGVRVGEVYEETRDVDGRRAHVFGWSYATLQGHFEQGRMHYEVWKWLDTGEVAFRLRSFSRAAEAGAPLLGAGFRLLGRTNQLRFYRQTCRRARRLTEAELEVAHTMTRRG
ncbi:MAG: DUF1990 family protein, partial [Gemmatimonadetes bacterium]|nr:DUF1990 family protein [Gemmatimonadota bacterium]